MSGIGVERINVPHAWRSSPVFAEPGARPGSYLQLPPGDITVDFGRRLEPWIIAVAKR